LLGWTQEELSEAADVNINTIRNLEAAGAEEMSAYSRTIEAVRKAFKTAGIEFIDENGGGVGVSCKRSDQEAANVGIPISQVS